MPMTGVVCDCGGVLRPVAKTQAYKGMQYGDDHQVAHFYACSKCKMLWYANCGIEIHVPDLKPYAGSFSETLLRRHVPQGKGHWYVRDEKRIFEPLATKKEVVPEDGKIQLPKSWAGVEVMISPIPRPKEVGIANPVDPEPSTIVPFDLCFRQPKNP